MWRTTTWCKIMAILIKICVFLMLFGIYDTTEWRPEIYAKGENVTLLQMNGKQRLEITFFGCTSKLHVNNVIFYDSRRNLTEQISINRNYTGRITMMNNGTLSFLLLNVNFMDSGNYTVSTVDGSVEKGKKSIIVPRTVLRVQDGASSLIVQFMCNKTNISSIKIEMITLTPFPITIYDVKQGKCSVYSFVSRIESCVLNENSFSLTFEEVSWLDDGTYVAWDDNGFLLDSIDLVIQEGTSSSNLETKKEYVTVPSTSNAKENGTSSSNLETKKEYVTVPSTSNAKENGTSSSNLETTKEYVTVPSTSNTKENEILVKLLFAGVGGALTVPFSFAITLLIIWRRGGFQFRLTGLGKRQREEKVICSERDIRMSIISCDTAHRGGVDEREYEELHSNSIDLSVYLEPTGIEPEQTEYNNPGNSYETLRPCENQGNNMYSSLTPEHTTET